MCTAATYKTNDFYFGRTLDYDFSYSESVVITPRNFPFFFNFLGVMEKHYAMIGVAYVLNDYPLYYDATNEKGLSIAGLNFPSNAYYGDFIEGYDNITQYELIPWILGQCDSVKSAREKIKKLNFVNKSFSDNLPLAQLHWMISDKLQSITVEATVDGLKIYDNPLGIMTNNPTFDRQMFYLNNFIGLSPKSPQNNFSNILEFDEYCKGLGALGLPGDLSSQSRFVRVAFTKANSLSKEDETSSVSQFFHILESVFQTRGCCDLGNDKYEITIYTSCCNTDKGIYYYKTYDNHQISAVGMYNENLDGKQLIEYPLITQGDIKMQN